MASACVNNNISMSTPTYGWLSPRISFSHDDDNPVSDPSTQDPPQDPTTFDFEFRHLDDPVTMLPADELFSDGKLVPLQVTNMRPSFSSSEIRSPEAEKSFRQITETEISPTDSYMFSPKAPRCSSRWKELLGFKKLYQNPTNNKTTSTTASPTSSNSNPKSLKHFLHRSSKSCGCNSDSSLILPLLKDLECESVSISSSRLSLSSSSSSHEYEDLPRLSLDSEKTNPNLTIQTVSPNPFVLNRNQNPPRMRMVKPKSDNETTRIGRSPMRKVSGECNGVTSRGVSVDSPRMNSSGKIVFQSLERSSSSPSSFNNGGPRYKHRGMERSYSANVRVTPVLNVPVCSLRGSSRSVSVFGFGQLFASSSPQKREGVNIKSQQASSSRNNRNDRA
ncbi:hypothetical protein K2173_016615 [Erythroxylum novogranatense]|uniref:Uncharacterized protein n=1 Tax=Erythroxylum novogranatense TaxID=1862640 RepID=A0AAV8SRZ4_9ROSI|nr:hypothetical protein K2173_016615 [Erythroxylum novogranatense]